MGGGSCRKVPGGAAGGSGSLVPGAGSRFQEFLPRKQIAHDKDSITVYSQEKKIQNKHLLCMKGSLQVSGTTNWAG